MATGELHHAILQALCRAAVRGIDADGRCLPCRAWIIAASHAKLKMLLPRLFPGCQVKTWRPKGSVRLSGRIRQALAHIDQLEREGFGDEITFPDLATALGMAHRDFRKQVTRDPRFLEEIADRGYAIADLERPTSKGPRTAKGIRRESDTFAMDPDADFSIQGLD